MNYTVILPSHDIISTYYALICLVENSTKLDEIIVIWDKKNIEEITLQDIKVNIKFITCHESNYDVYTRANLGAFLAKNDWILFYQDDVYPQKNWDENLDKILDNLTEDQKNKLMINFNIVEPGYSGVNENRAIKKSFGISWVTFKKDAFEKYAKETTDSHPDLYDTSLGWLNPVMFNRKYFLSLGGYSGKPYPSSADMDLFIKIESEGSHIKVNKMFYHFQCGGINKRKDCLYLIMKWIGNPEA